MGAPLHVYRLFHESEASRDMLHGLDLRGFDTFHPATRESGPFTGLAAARINSGEAFAADAIAVVRDGALTVGNPFGAGTCTTSDLAACPATPWTSVPLYLARFQGDEPFTLVKRGLSWCTDLGVVFPRRGLFVSFQTEDRRMAQDLADVAHAEQWFAAHGRSAFESAPAPARSSVVAVPITSGHFAHHLWNELSVVQALVDAGLQRQVQLLVGEAPIAPLTTLFPEIPASRIEVIADGPEGVMRTALARGAAVAPAGRRHVPRRLIGRVLDVARAQHPVAAAAAADFRKRHAFVLWVTLRLEARTATNLVETLGTLVGAVAARHPGVGVVVDGFTIPAGVGGDWNRPLIVAEQGAVPSLVEAMGGVAYVSLVGRPTTEAFLWAAITDYYVCPYGSAQHKVAWINPVPGLVHAGENKRAVATTDAGFYVRQSGALPRFFFSPVTRIDPARDQRTDLQSYTLDPAAFAAAVLDDVAARVR